jgi:undecaprenyl-diphosphatase
MASVKSVFAPAGRMSPLEWLAILGSILLASFLLVDPLVFSLVNEFDPQLKGVFQRLTHLGRSTWILFPTGAAVIVLLGLRTRDIGARSAVAYAYVAQLCAFVFVSVAGAGIITSLGKNIIGRARPKLYDAVGSIEFEPFTFHADFASFPSGHATTIFALAAALAILFPKARIYLLVAATWIAATRFLIGTHYFSDTVAGAIVGTAFAQFLMQRMAARRWLFQTAQDGSVELRGRSMMPWMVAQLRQAISPRGR